MKRTRGVGKNTYAMKKIRQMNKALAPPKLAGVGVKPYNRKRGNARNG